MDNQFDAIVIGAGNGGLSTATKLATSGKKVLLLERHNVPGGCGTSFCRGRFEFEVALHQLSSMGTDEEPGPCRKLFEDYGIFDQLDLIPIQSLYNVNLPGGFSQSLPTTKEGCIRELTKTFPEEAENIKKYYDIVFKFCEESDAFAAMSAKSKGEPGALKKFIVSKAFKIKFPHLAKYAMRSTQDVLDEITHNQKLQLCWNAYWCFMGMPPARFPFTILAKCTYIYLTDKPAFLVGGSQVMSQALTEAIKKNNGIVKMNCGAKRILVNDKNEAYGVEDENGETYYSKVIVSGISPIDTYFKLVDKDKVPQSAIDYLKPYTVGISAFTIFLGLDCPPEELGFKESFNLTYEDMDCNKCFENAYKLLPTIDPIISTNYTVDDKRVSPKHASNMTVGVLKYARPWMELSADEYYKKKYECADLLLKRMEKIYPGIRDHIEEMEIATPLTHMRYLHHPEGAIYGFEQDLSQSVFFFPKESQIKNLEFSSGWVNTCGFGPNYLNGAVIGEKILKEYK